MDYTIVHLSAEKRFETKSEELTAYVQYQITDGKLDIIHTVVPHPIEGRGIASALVRLHTTLLWRMDLSRLPPVHTP